MCLFYSLVSNLFSEWSDFSLWTGMMKWCFNKIGIFRGKMFSFCNLTSTIGTYFLHYGIITWGHLKLEEGVGFISSSNYLNTWTFFYIFCENIDEMLDIYLLYGIELYKNFSLIKWGSPASFVPQSYCWKCFHLLIWSSYGKTPHTFLLPCVNFMRGLFYLYIWLIVFLCCTPTLVLSHVYCKDSCWASGNMPGLYNPLMLEGSNSRCWLLGGPAISSWNLIRFWKEIGEVSKPASGSVSLESVK